MLVKKSILYALIFGFCVGNVLNVCAMEEKSTETLNQKEAPEITVEVGLESLDSKWFFENQKNKDFGAARGSVRALNAIKKYDNNAKSEYELYPNSIPKYRALRGKLCRKQKVFDAFFNIQVRDVPEEKKVIAAGSAKIKERRIEWDATEFISYDRKPQGFKPGDECHQMRERSKNVNFCEVRLVLSY